MSSKNTNYFFAQVLQNLHIRSSLQARVGRLADTRMHGGVTSTRGRASRMRNTFRTLGKSDLMARSFPSRLTSMLQMEFTPANMLRRYVLSSLSALHKIRGVYSLWPVGHDTPCGEGSEHSLL